MKKEILKLAKIIKEIINYIDDIKVENTDSFNGFLTKLTNNKRESQNRETLHNMLNELISKLENTSNNIEIKFPNEPPSGFMVWDSGWECSGMREGFSSREEAIEDVWKFVYNATKPLVEVLLEKERNDE